MGRAKSILDKSYFRAEEKDKVNKLHLETVHCIHKYKWTFMNHSKKSTASFYLYIIIICIIITLWCINWQMNK